MRARSVSLLGMFLVLLGGSWYIIATSSSDGPEPAATAPNSAITTPAEPSFDGDDATRPATEAATALPTQQPSTMEVLVGRDDDLGTGSTEFSAVTLNEDLNRLVIADDGDRLFEFDLDADGAPVVPPRRILNVEVGGGDTEGLAWMYGSTYAIASENTGLVTIVELDDELLTLDERQVRSSFSTGIAEIDGNGLEGVAFVPRDDGIEQFVVADERPPMLRWVDERGAVIRSLVVDAAITDVSDVWVGADGQITVLSDESQRLVELELNDAGTELLVIESIDLDLDGGQFVQPEGVARSRDRRRLYVVGEMPGEQRYSLVVFRSER